MFQNVNELFRTNFKLIKMFHDCPIVKRCVEAIQSRLTKFKVSVRSVGPDCLSNRGSNRKGVFSRAYLEQLSVGGWSGADIIYSHHILQEHLRLLAVICNPGMVDRHWGQIAELFEGDEFVIEAQASLSTMLDWKLEDKVHPPSILCYIGN